jgi:hypothetical protein
MFRFCSIGNFERARWGIIEKRKRKSMSGRSCHPATAAALGMLHLAHGMAMASLPLSF